MRLLNVFSEEKWKNNKMQQDQHSDADLAMIKYKELGRKQVWEEISAESQTFKAYWAQWQSLELHDGCLHHLQVVFFFLK